MTAEPKRFMPLSKISKISTNLLGQPLYPTLGKIGLLIGVLQIGQKLVHESKLILKYMRMFQDIFTEINLKNNYL